jgi:hypothetical protein
MELRGTYNNESNPLLPRAISRIKITIRAELGGGAILSIWISMERVYDEYV